MLESPHTTFDAIPLAFAGAPPEAVRGLFDRMSSSDAFTARRATQALGTMGPRAQAGIPVLLAALRHEDPLVRMHAATALGAISISDTGGISALRGLLDDPDQRVRSAASNSLAKLSTDHRRPAPPK
jgi:HEAT repeat protein